MPSNSDITVKLIETPAELEGAFSLRIRVFVGEQGVPADIEVDEADTDPGTVHAVALHNGVIIGTGRLLPDVDGKGPHIGRMAVERDRRRDGIGGQVLNFLEDQGRARGFRQITLHAQEYVKSFYAGHGYREVGDIFEEAGISHREMVKEL
ncbi:MAG: GNAT family N-acetyltransferase [Chloroflexi bacterium]|nr:GNAT family N-acetyltransferase [Chloroflexota bacterium]